MQPNFNTNYNVMALTMYNILENIPGLNVMSAKSYLHKGLHRGKKTKVNVLLIQKYYGSSTTLYTPDGFIMFCGYLLCDSGYNYNNDVVQFEKNGIFLEMIYPNVYIVNKGHTGPYYIIKKYDKFNYDINNYPEVSYHLNYLPIFDPTITYTWNQQEPNVQCARFHDYLQSFMQDKNTERFFHRQLATPLLRSVIRPIVSANTIGTESLTAHLTTPTTTTTSDSSRSYGITIDEPSIQQELGKINDIDITLQTQQSSKQNENDKDQTNFCPICIENKANAVIVPCGHTVCFFDKCKNMITNCPICRNSIEKIIRFYQN